MQDFKPWKDGFTCEACDRQFTPDYFGELPIDYRYIADLLVCVDCYNDNGIGLDALAESLPERE